MPRLWRPSSPFIHSLHVLQPQCYYGAIVGLEFATGFGMCSPFSYGFLTDVIDRDQPKVPLADVIFKVKHGIRQYSSMYVRYRLRTSCERRNRGHEIRIVSVPKM